MPPPLEETPGISIQRLTEVLAERAARRTGGPIEPLRDVIFHGLREMVGWKLFDRDAQ